MNHGAVIKTDFIWKVYGILEFNVPLDTVQVISETGLGKTNGFVIHPNYLIGNCVVPGETALVALNETVL